MDLPGHGERAVDSYQTVEGTLQTILEMSEELDEVHAAIVGNLRVDPEQIAIGGMSAGGMAAAHRLVTPHPYRAMLMEASTGNWAAQAHRPMFQPLSPEALQAHDPMAFGHLDPHPSVGPTQPFGRWIRFEGQCEFGSGTRSTDHPVELQAYDQTGAPKNTLDSGNSAPKPRICAEIFFFASLSQTAEDR